MKKAVIIWGGWEGHKPEQIANVFKNILEEDNFEVRISNSLKTLEEKEYLNSVDLLVPIWTLGELENIQSKNVIHAVADGMGIAGCHGGFCDAFRNNVHWQFMTGGNFVGHPGDDEVEYMVNISNPENPIVDSLSDFMVKSEQFYLHFDPAVEILATTRFPTVTWYHSTNKPVDMPVVWTKMWGLGRVFYNALGHNADIFDIPEARTIMRRGFIWAAAGKEKVLREGLTSDIYRSKKNNRKQK